MKHPSSRAFFAYWDEKRGTRRAPERAELEPAPVRHLLGDIFVLAYDLRAGFPFRVAGTRLCALLGCDPKGSGFASFFDSASRRDFEDVVGNVAEDALAAVAGVTGRNDDGTITYLELLLLPFHARANTPLSLTGLLAPLDNSHLPLRSVAPLQELALTSWRYMGHRPEKLGPRIVRKLAVARGLMVYEGLK